MYRTSYMHVVRYAKHVITLHMGLRRAAHSSSLLPDFVEEKPLFSAGFTDGWSPGSHTTFAAIPDVRLVPPDGRAVGVEALCRCMSECQFGQITAGSHYSHLSAC